MFGEFGPSRTNLIGRSEMTFFARFWGHLRAIEIKSRDKWHSSILVYKHRDYLQKNNRPHGGP